MKSNRLRWLVIACGSGLFSLGAALCLVHWREPATPIYHRITTGMTEKQVEAVIGHTLTDYYQGTGPSHPVPKAADTKIGGIDGEGYVAVGFGTDGRLIWKAFFPFNSYEPDWFTRLRVRFGF